MVYSAELLASTMQAFNFVGAAVTTAQGVPAVTRTSHSDRVLGHGEAGAPSLPCLASLGRKSPQSPLSPHCHCGPVSTWMPGLSPARQGPGEALRPAAAYGGPGALAASPSQGLRVHGSPGLAPGDARAALAVPA